MNRVTLMKIDVEGWETRVLKGGLENFTGNEAPTLLVEFADSSAHPRCFERLLKHRLMEVMPPLDTGLRIGVMARRRERPLPTPIPVGIWVFP